MDRTEAEAEQRIRAALGAARRAGRAAPHPGPPRRRAALRRPGRGRAVGRRRHPGARDRRRRSRRGRAGSLPGADVVVHVEPSEPPGDLRERATAAASSVPEVREVHNVRVMHLPEGYELSLHVKLPSELSLTEAHGVVERLEQLVRAAIPELRNVHTHIEPLAGTDWAHRRASDDTATERAAIEETVRRVTGAEPAAVAFRDGEDGPHRARDDHAARRAAAALGPPPRRRDRGGRARALPLARRRDRAHRAEAAA